MSLIGEYNAEWRTRKINLFSVLRSFVYQLSPGQDLTKVSLPSELCHPFSMLELIAYREMQLFHILFEINEQEESLDRFMVVLKWYMGMVREETVEKKPFNPVIGETHLCWVKHKSNDDVHYSEFIGEQVSHHPPVTAFVVRNTKNDIKIMGDVTFQVGFGTNCATVITGGGVTIHTSKEKFTMTKCMPDMMVNNVVWGERYLMWYGGVTIACPDSGYSAYVELKEEDGRNLILGQVFDSNKNVIYNLSGFAGQTTYLQKPNSNQKTVLVDITKYQENIITYMPEDVQEEFSTLKVWVPVKNAIVDNDMVRADETKKVIEADQRVREAAKKADGLVNEGRYFYRPKTDAEDANHETEEKARINWIFRDNVKIDEEWLEATTKKLEEIEAAKALKAQQELDENTKSESEKEETCSVQ